MGERNDSMVVPYKTLVLGASIKPERYAYQAVVLLQKHQIEVVAMGIQSGEIGSTSVVEPFIKLKAIHTVSIYLSPKHQSAYFDYVIDLRPQRVIFNPGTENLVFTKLLDKAGILWENACTLVLLSTNQYQT